MSHIFLNSGITRTACKLLAVVIVVAVLLVGAVWNLSATQMLLAGGPVLFLGCMDAGCLGRQRRYFLARGKAGNADTKGDGNEDADIFSPEPESDGMMRTARALMSLSIWPFYLGLFAVAMAGSGMFFATGRVPAAPTPIGALRQSMVKTTPAATPVKPVAPPAGPAVKGTGVVPISMPSAAMPPSMPAHPAGATAPPGSSGKPSLLPGAPTASQFLQNPADVPRPAGPVPRTMVLPQTPANTGTAPAPR